MTVTFSMAELVLVVICMGLVGIILGGIIGYAFHKHMVRVLRDEGKLDAYLDGTGEYQR